MMQDTFTVRAPDGTEYRVQAPAGATEQDIMAHVQAEHDATPKRMSAEDEAEYIKLAQDPHATAGQLVDYVAAKGFNLDRRTADAFIEQRAAAGGQAGNQVSYLDAQHPQAAPEAPQPPEEHNSLREDIRAAAGRFADGAFPGAASTIRGIRGAIDNTWDAVVHGKDWEPGKAFDEYADDMKKVTKRFSDEHPDLGDGLGWAGFGASFLAPELRVARGGTLGAHAINGLATGAAYGAGSGLLNDSGDGRLANAGNGLMFGAGVGAAAPLALRSAFEIGGYAKRTVPFAARATDAIGAAASRARGLPTPPPHVTARAQAERLLGREMRNGNISLGMGASGPAATPEAVRLEVARRQAMGVPAMPADTSERLRSSLQWALEGRGPLTSMARERLQARQLQQGPRVRQHVQDELGQAVDPIAEAEAITSRARAAAASDYQAAYAQGSPMVIDQTLGELMGRPAVRDALPQAYRNIENLGRNPEGLGFRMHEDGSVSMSQQPSFEAFDQVTRTMNGQLKRNPLTGRPDLDNETGAIHSVMKEMDGHLRSINPAYDAAKRNYADEMAVRDALERGGAVERLSGPEIAAQLRTMPPHAQEAWIAGARTALAQAATDAGLSPSSNATQRVRQAIGLSGGGSAAAPGDVAKLQAIETLSGRPGALGRLDDRLEAENQAYNAYSEAYSNPRSAGGLVLADQMAGNVVGTAGKVATGNLKGAAADLLYRNRGAKAFKGHVQDRMAEVLTAVDPQEVQEAMAAIARRGARDRAYTGALQRTGIKLGQIGALQAAGAPTLPDPYDVPDVPGYSR